MADSGQSVQLISLLMNNNNIVDGCGLVWSETYSIFAPHFFSVRIHKNVCFIMFIIQQISFFKDFAIKIIYFLFFSTEFQIIFATKYRISTPLIMENPVRSPMVPPIADNMSTNFAALSLVILSNVGVSKYMNIL